VTLGHNPSVLAIQFFGEPDRLIHRTQIRFSGVLSIIYWLLLLFFSFGTPSLLLLLLLFFSHTAIIIFLLVGSSCCSSHLGLQLFFCCYYFFFLRTWVLGPQHAPSPIDVKPEVCQGRNYDLPTNRMLGRFYRWIKMQNCRVRRTNVVNHISYI
jgi:hypothetical protein